MDKNHLLQITNELYRLTLLFPKKEPLRYKMRELADDILADFVFFSSGNPLLANSTIVKNTSEKLEVLDGFFEVAKSQNWVSPNDILKLQEEYSKLGEELEGIKEKTKKLPLEKKKEITGVEPLQIEKNLLRQEIMSVRQQKILDSNPPTTRQGKILDFLKEKGKVQVWQVKEIFPEVSKRTLRRDFNNLLKEGIIERIGERNDTFYVLRRQES